MIPEGVRFSSRYHLHQLLLLASLSTLVACNPPVAPTSAGHAGGPDAGTAAPGTADAGSPDAGAADAGTADAGTADAGSSDAGITDAGITDAGITDAGLADAGIADAGIADAGTSDGGTGVQPFVHPGLLHTQADFDRMGQKVGAQASPWIDGWNRLTNNSHAKLTWTPNPQVVISRGPDNTYPDNSATFFNDVAAAYACALRWKVSGDHSYADKAVQIMNAWSAKLTTIGGTSGNPTWDGFLMAGIQGYQFANAGEIMRTYPGWAAADFARFQGMMRNIFYPTNHAQLPSPGGDPNLLVYSNWNLCSMASILAIGVLTDYRALFDEAITFFKTGLGNGGIAQAIYYIHPGYLGQTQESGRDQGHNTLSLALTGTSAQLESGASLFRKWPRHRH
jgi:hypothetical protein